MSGMIEIFSSYNSHHAHPSLDSFIRINSVMTIQLNDLKCNVRGDILKFQLHANIFYYYLAFLFQNKKLLCMFRQYFKEKYIILLNSG